MNQDKKTQATQKPHQKPTTITSEVLPDGQIIETGFDPESRQTYFLIFNKGAVERHNHLKVTKLHSRDTLLKPMSPDDALIKNKLVVLPSNATPYANQESLIDEIKQFIHRYVDLSDSFLTAACYFVLLSWVYDQFNELPYLRKVGDFGSGKTRFLKVVGALCYKATFASGGTSTAALFHIIDQIKGTLVLDEADFHFSDEKAAVAKILNNGNAAGFPLLRVSQTSNGQFRPISYNVFCPKVIASRGNYDDQALESRFITESYRPPTQRRDIPVSLPDEFETEALALRNKLLMFRFSALSADGLDKQPAKLEFEGRINQIFQPLLALASNRSDETRLTVLAEGYNQLIQEERGHGIEAQLLTSISILQSQSKTLSMKAICRVFIDEFSDHYDRKITAKWIGHIVRKRLKLKTRKTAGNFVLDENGLQHKLTGLYQRYGVQTLQNRP